MGLTAVQELTRILQNMRRHGKRSIWLSDCNLRAFSARIGQFSPQASAASANQPSRQPAAPAATAPIAPAPAAPFRMAGFRERANGGMQPPPPPIPQPAAAAPVAQQICAPAAGYAEKIAASSWEELEQAIGECKYCPYGGNCGSRHGHIGARKPRILFVGDYPGMEEAAGKAPFESAAGQMLYKMGVAMGLSWEAEAEGNGVALVNLLKCRPATMMPMQSALDICILYLRRQIELLEPKALVLLGALPNKSLGLLGSGTFSQIEGKMQDYHGIAAMPIKHPTAIMRFASQQNLFVAERRRAWIALQELMKL